GQDNAINEEVDEQPVQDLALNVDNVFQVDDCDAFDSNVDEAPIAQTMFMVNLSFADPVYDEAGPSYDSNILSEVHDHDHYQVAVCEHHEEHKMHDNVQLNDVVDSHADYTSDSNMILYDQYVKDNAMPGVQTGTPSSTTIDQDAPSQSHSPSCSDLQSPSLHQGVAAESTLMEDNLVAPVDKHPFINVFAPEPSSDASSFGDVSSAESTYVSQTLHHLGKLSKDHPLDNVIGNPSRPVSTRKQLAIDALWCLYNSVLSKFEPKNFKYVITKDC
nr:integrase, catalytic region, zinc finger, CCHC-type, peptidase aspartic, catalytic [Tanacetum cinerariifolium]